MARSGNSRGGQKTREVTFSIELRPATYEQLDAGKRLFSRLIATAQTAKNERAESARADRRKPPPVQSPSLTNRGTLSSREA
jgi:hypothetical protein